MRTIKLKTLVLLIVSLFFVQAGMASAEIVIIGNKAGALNALSKKEAQDVFLGKTRSIRGESIKPVDLASNSAERKEFLDKVLEQSASKVNRYWSRKIFSGKGNPPEVLDSGETVKRWVARNPGGIGYISASAVDKSVKVLLKVR